MTTELRRMFNRITRPELVRKAFQYIDEHRERGCGDFGGTEYFDDAGRLVSLPCLCDCDDHPCRDLAMDADAAYVCPTCRDAGMVSSRARDPAARSFGRAEPCPMCRTDRERRSIAFARSLVGFDAAYIDEYRFDNLDGAPAEAAAWARDDHRTWMLVLSGPNGTGKTHAALACARDWLQRGKYAYFTLTIELLDALRSTFNRQSERTAEDILRLPLAVDLLILDDLGAETNTDYAAEKLFLVIDSRMRKRLPTVITTEITPATAPRSRLWSRVFGDRLVTVIHTEGQDRRQW